MEGIYNGIEKANYIKQQQLRISKAIKVIQTLIEGTDVESLTIGTDAITAKLKRPMVELNVNIEDSRSCAIETISFKRYESRDSGVIYAVMDYLENKDADAIFLDIGANEGIYTLAALKREKPLHVHSFEPVPATCELLKDNLKLNGVMADNVACLAITNQIGSKEFVYAPELSGSSSFVDLLELDSSKKILVKTDTLDKYCEIQSIEPDFIKIDVEGSEHLVIEGYKATLKKTKKKPLLYIEILRKWSNRFGYKANDIFKTIIEIGYEGYTCCRMSGLIDCEEITEDTEATNFLFVPNCFVEIENLKKRIKWYQCN